MADLELPGLNPSTSPGCFGTGANVLAGLNSNAAHFTWEGGRLVRREDTQFGAELSLYFPDLTPNLAVHFDFLGEFACPGSGPRIVAVEVVNTGSKLTGAANIGLQASYGGDRGGFSQVQDLATPNGNGSANIAMQNFTGNLARYIPSVINFRRLRLWKTQDFGIVGTTQCTRFTLGVHILFMGNSS